MVLLFLLTALIASAQVGQNKQPGATEATFQTTTQLVIETVTVKGKDGKPVSLQNLKSNFTSNNMLCKSVKLEHTGDDKAFVFSNTHGLVSHFSASGEIK